MVNKDEHEEWVIRLGELMSNTYASVHRHVADRLAVLLGMGEVAWVDGTLKDENMSVSGRLLVFTHSVVAIVDLVDEMRGHDSLSGGPLKGATDVILVPRRSLSEVRLMSTGPGEREHSAYVWSRVTADGRPNNEGWPGHSAPVELVYGDRVVTVNDVIGGGREGFDVFMASLLADLAK